MHKDTKYEQEAEAEQVLTLASLILKALDDRGTEENIAQAALGTAWITLCRAIGWEKKHFLSACEDAAHMEWNIKYED